MTDDATLSEFTATDESASGSSTDDDGSSSETAPVPKTTIQPTYAWGTYTCNRCEQSTDRVWRGDGEFVCPDCKTW
ncbi:hypothetical protein [Natrinema sp. HArc-T2]|uniref:DUF7573 domain-containing protein n=1 Tax=Natrinema sp. HArc-T2 TaxID=3242701 RepID=UPI00359DE5C5